MLTKLVYTTLFLIMLLNTCNSFQRITKRSLIRTLASKSKRLYYKNINGYEPKSDNQENYLNLLNDDRIKLIIANGPAGTGKTLLACQTAIKKLIDRDISKIVITRPVVPVEEDIGFLPGTINKKMDPWTRPIMDIFSDFQFKNDQKSVEISPLGFMRGRTFKDSVIIADEMQNCSPNQMLMLLTRLGDDSKLVITGDLKQCDKDDSGLQDLLSKLRLYYDNENNMAKDGIAIINFEAKDVQRSPLVSKILDIYGS